MQLTTTHYRSSQYWTRPEHCNSLQLTATHCTSLQPIAPHCNTLQHSATSATHCRSPQHWTRPTRPGTAAYCRTHSRASNISVHRTYSPQLPPTPLRSPRHPHPHPPALTHTIAPHPHIPNTPLPPASSLSQPTLSSQLVHTHKHTHTHNTHTHAQPPQITHPQPTPTHPTPTHPIRLSQPTTFHHSHLRTPVRKRKREGGR